MKSGSSLHTVMLPPPAGTILLYAADVGGKPAVAVLAERDRLTYFVRTLRLISSEEAEVCVHPSLGTV